MPTTATGNFALVVQNLETLLVNSTTWQTLCGAASADAARANVYWLGAAPTRADDDPPTRPMAWIKMGDGWTAEMEHSGGGANYHRFGLELLIELDDTEPGAGTGLDDKDFAKERIVIFLNQLGLIIAEMEALAKTDGYLHVSQIRMTSHSISDYQEKETEGLYQQAVFQIQVW